MAVAKVTLPGGEVLSKRVLAAVDAAFREVGLDPDKHRVVSQGSWSSGTLSAGTHGGNGALDLSLRLVPEAKWEPLVVALRRRMGDAWLRIPKYGWHTGNHIHCIFADQPGLSDGAKQQVREYNAGGDGLVGTRPDPHPRPKQRPWPWKGTATVLFDATYGFDAPGGKRIVKRSKGFKVYYVDTAFVDGETWLKTRWGRWYRASRTTRRY